MTFEPTKPLLKLLWVHELQLVLAAENESLQGCECVFPHSHQYCSCDTKISAGFGNADLGTICKTFFAFIW